MPPLNEAAWQEKLAALRAHVAAHGRLPPFNRGPGGLGIWLIAQRAAKKAADAGEAHKSRMAPERAAALEAVPGWAWGADVEADWRERLAALRAYVGAHGRLPPQGDASGLGTWVNTQRKAKKAAAVGRKGRNKMARTRGGARGGARLGVGCEPQARARVECPARLTISGQLQLSAAHYKQRSF